MLFIVLRTTSWGKGVDVDVHVLRPQPASGCRKSLLTPDPLVYCCCRAVRYVPAPRAAMVGLTDVHSPAVLGLADWTTLLGAAWRLREALSGWACPRETAWHSVPVSREVGSLPPPGSWARSALGAEQGPLRKLLASVRPVLPGWGARCPSAARWPCHAAVR